MPIQPIDTIHFDLILHPSALPAHAGQSELFCGSFPIITIGEQPEDDMVRKSLNSLEAFMIRPAAAEFFQSLPIEEKKKFEGLEGFSLAAAIEEYYELASLDQVFTTLPTPARKKIEKLPADERYTELRKLKFEIEQQSYSAERQQARKTAEYVKKNLVPEQQSLFAPYPHSLARRSVFFIEENERMERDYLNNFIIGAGPWGLTTYSGKKLYTADEKAWVVLLGLAGEQKKRGIVDWHVVKGSIRSFLREAGLSESGHYSERFIESIQAMHGGVFQFEGKTKPNEHGKPIKRSLKERVEGWHLISSYTVDNISNEFVVILDRAFIETFITEFHMYARLDIKTFCKQPPTASALNRFFVGHTPDPDGCIRMNLFLVAKATNMLTDHGQDLQEWPSPEVKYAKKRTINRALKRLAQDATFGPRTGIKSRKRGEDDLVIIDYQVAGKPLKPTVKKKLLPRKPATS